MSNTNRTFYIYYLCGLIRNYFEYYLCHLFSGCQHENWIGFFEFFFMKLKLEFAQQLHIFTIFFIQANIICCLYTLRNSYVQFLHSHFGRI